MAGLFLLSFCVGTLAVAFRWPGAWYWTIGWIILFFLVGNGIIPCWLTTRLQTGFVSALVHFSGSHAIVILMGDGVVEQNGRFIPSLFAYSRIARAAQLYHSIRAVGLRCTILVTGDNGIGAGKKSVYVDYLEKIGIDASSIVLEPFGRNSYAQAQRCAKLIHAMQADRTILVTSGLHVRRSLLYDRYFGVNAEATPSDEVSRVLTILPIACNFAITDIVMHQYVGMARFYFYSFLGLNSRER